jgi:hypothetical protein
MERSAINSEEELMQALRNLIKLRDHNNQANRRLLYRQEEKKAKEEEVTCLV